MLQIIRNRSKPQAKKIIAEEQTDFRAGRSTTEQIFNLKILCEKYLQHQQDLLPCLHGLQGLWQGLACSFAGNYEEVKHQRQPYPNHQTPLWHGQLCSRLQRQHRRLGFRTTVLTHPFQHISWKDHDRRLGRSRRHGRVSIGGRTITNLCLADDIDGLPREKEKLAKLLECLDKFSTAYGIEINAEKTKLMTDNTSGINSEIKVNGQKLETVTSFKYQGSVITDEGSNPEILSRLAQTTATLTKVKPVWNDRCIFSEFQNRLTRSLVTFTFLYSCEPWTLTADLKRRIQAVEMRCYRKILRISHKDLVANEEVRAKIQQANSEHTKTSWPW